MATAQVNGVRLFYEMTGAANEALPHAVLTVPGAGHIPHATHPDAYVEAIVAFIRKLRA